MKTTNFNFDTLSNKLAILHRKILIYQVKGEPKKESKLWYKTLNVLKEYEKKASFQASLLSIVSFQSNQKKFERTAPKGKYGRDI